MYKRQVGTPLSEVASQADQFIRYKCKKGECGTCEVQVNGKWVRTCVATVPYVEDNVFEVTVKPTMMKGQGKASKFYSLKSFVMGWYNNILGMVGFVKTSATEGKNFRDRLDGELKNLDRKQSTQFAKIDKVPVVTEAERRQTKAIAAEKTTINRAFDNLRADADYNDPNALDRIDSLRDAAVDGVTRFGWSGSAVLGGYLVDRGGYALTFLITAGMQLLAAALWLALVGVVDAAAAGARALCARRGDAASDDESDAGGDGGPPAPRASGHPAPGDLDAPLLARPGVRRAPGSPRHRSYEEHLRSDSLESESYLSDYSEMPV